LEISLFKSPLGVDRVSRNDDRVFHAPNERNRGIHAIHFIAFFPYYSLVPLYLIPFNRGAVSIQHYQPGGTKIVITAVYVNCEYIKILKKQTVTLLNFSFCLW